MRLVYQQELAEIQDRLVEIAGMVESAIRRATEAFNNSNVALAEEVIDDDELVDVKAEELDALVIGVMARQQPVASDLRLMVGSLRMSSSLERMADLAQHIAQLARYRYPESAIPRGLKKTFRRMGELDILIAQEMVKLLRELEIEHIRNIRNYDTEVDELHAKVFAKVLSEKLSNNPTGVVDATLASRYHERFGDHAKKITEQVHFYVTGDVTVSPELTGETED